MKQKKLLALLLTLVLLLGLLCGCGSTEDIAAYDKGPYAEGESAADANFSAAYEAPTEVAEETSQEAAPSVPQAETENLTEKIIYSANVSMQTREFDKTTAAIEKSVADAGGFIESSGVNGDTDYAADGTVRVINRYANYTLRIPSKAFDGFLTQIGALGNVTASSRYAENVTASYTDTELKLKSLQTQEERLLAMLEKADDVETLVALEERLSEVRYEIESARSTLTNYDRKVLYSTIYLTLEEVAVYTPTASATRSFPQRMADAFSAGFRGFGEAMGEIFLWLIEALPTLLLLAAVVIVICVIVSRKKKKRKAQKPQDPQA